MIIVQNRRASLTKLQDQFDNPMVLDVTSRSSQPWIRFSPFYPHGGIPVPFSPMWFSASVEGIWQGLKVFEGADIDVDKFKKSTMKNIKRLTKIYENVLGHREGVEGDQLLSYKEARYEIYLPSYYWVLENCLQNLLANLEKIV